MVIETFVLECPGSDTIVSLTPPVAQTLSVHNPMKSSSAAALVHCLIAENSWSGFLSQGRVEKSSKTGRTSARLGIRTNLIRKLSVCSGHDCVRTKDYNSTVSGGALLMDLRGHVP
jgi:hypothetical protein